MGLIALRPYVVGKGGGDPNRIDFGTGRAQPRGVESFLNYDGFLLNNRKLLDTYVITQIDGLADPDVRDSRDVNPGRHGETYFNAYYGGRTIALTGKIRANTIQKLRDMQMELRQAFSDLGDERPLIFGAEDASSAVYLNCKKSQPIAMSEVQADFTYRRDFQVTLRASNPRFLSYDQEWLTWRATTPLTPGRVVGVIKLTNDGNFGAEPVVQIDGPVLAAVNGGPALKLSAVQNIGGVITRRSFTINARPGTTIAVAKGHYLELDSARRTLVDVGLNRVKTNIFDQLDITSDWTEFPPGDSTIELTSYGPSQPTMLVRYRHTYL